MIWVVLVGQAATLWLLWRFRRYVERRVLVWEAARSAGISESDAATPRPGYPGAVPPNRFVVVRWPGELYFYQGADGSAAKKMYEHTHPGKGQEVEFWELGSRRGHKVG